MMVAKLSRRCFNLVTQMRERLKMKVTQTNFINLYRKHQKDQFELLSNLLEGRISFNDLNSKQRRVSSYVISYSKSNFCFQTLFGEKKTIYRSKQSIYLQYSVKRRFNKAKGRPAEISKR